MLPKLRRLFSASTHPSSGTELTEQEIRKTVATLIDPNTGKSFDSANAIRAIECTSTEIHIHIALAYPANSQNPTLRNAFSEILSPLLGKQTLTVHITNDIPAYSVQTGLSLLNGVKNTIVVASGKGGVGKSTTAVNLALALSAEGARVGILDADIYGPSQPMMLGCQGERPQTTDNNKLLPVMSHRIQTMSIGYLVDTDQAVVWRGPMVSQALQQLLRDTQWDALDYLIIDMPPGTGDAQLTLAQKIPVTGALIVTTPQDIALLDVRRAIKMFEKVGVPILGIVENMALHTCVQCGHTAPIFGEGGAQRIAAEYGVELLGSLPLDIGIRMAVDGGKPTVIAEPEGSLASLYKTIARRAAVRISEKARDTTSKFPKIIIKKT